MYGREHACLHMCKCTPWTSLPCWQTPHPLQPCCPSAYKPCSTPPQTLPHASTSSPHSSRLPTTRWGSGRTQIGSVWHHGPIGDRSRSAHTAASKDLGMVRGVPMVVGMQAWEENCGLGGLVRLHAAHWVIKDGFHRAAGGCCSLAWLSALLECCCGAHKAGQMHGCPPQFPTKPDSISQKSQKLPAPPLWLQKHPLSPADKPPN